MAQQINPPRGMRDFLPADKARRERVLSTILDTYRRHGFTQIETPVLEELSRLTSGMGGDNEKLAFRVLRRGLTREKLQHALETGDEADLSDLGLRFDLTVPLARYYASHHAELPKVFRSIQAGPVWRAERPQKGRYRQFVQCDIDILGEPTVLAELELITATSAALAELGLIGATIRINDRGILNAILADSGFAEADTARVLISIDKLDKIGADGVLAELRDAGLGAQAERLGAFLERVEQLGLQPLSREAVTKALGDIEAPEAVDNLVTIAEALAATTADDAPAAAGARRRGAPAAARLVFDPTLVRGMGYYTGTIFEISHPSSKSSVGGGGRYDGMIGRFLGQQVPAAGFSIGFERIIDLVDDSASGPEGGLVLLADRKAPAPNLIVIKAQALAQTDHTRVDIVTEPKKAGRLLDELAADGYTHFARVAADTVAYADLEVRPLG
ncbi:histidine--tRNA ligase [Pseudoclavibacter sp. 13-3]|uniref:histidine--tRNA ligase n=1 Tax=Pseudoclavibacter sp. 13-3 TaxID=2901228 RepID=UPI001E4481D6|nr:histidine--tRNA ligase [Pseudoclavibacter sp. 13-3]MCD7102251.1 histidine--tRNA ligase [Pseudoclavibacter sp. 13-3]